MAFANGWENFTTFATPHLGVRTPLRGWHNHVWNVFGARTLSMSGRQLFIIDNFRGTGRPLLSVLADPDSVFIKGLALFKRRTLYTNIINDRSAVYYTTGISKTDPFKDLNKIQIKYVPGYEDVVLDPIGPYTPPEPVSAESLSFLTRLTIMARSFFSRVPLTLVLTLFIPIGAVAFLINSVIQTAWSTRRIRLHEAGRAGIQISTYRTPLLITGIREAVEETYENLNNAQDNQYLLSGNEEEALENDPPTLTLRERSESPMSSGPMSETATPEKRVPSASPSPSIDSINAADDPVQLQSRHLDIPMLALTPDQFAMIHALDNVGWRKYPVYIHKNRHSHAAMIVRMNKKTFDEGYIVLRHWLNEEFLMD
jgi:hypothetical protein